jgi:hypothetical protein
MVGQHRLANDLGIAFARFVIRGVDRKGDPFVFSFPSVLGGSEKKSIQGVK